MSDVKNVSDLESQLQAQLSTSLKARKNALVGDDVAGIVREIIHCLGGAVSSADLKFYTELEALARFIRQAKHDIASIKPKDISTNYIPNATDELDAVVGATEEATNKIMDVCDEISAVAEGCSEEAKAKLIGCTTKIFEACNFQDITGQRITKVVETLKHIDSRVEALVKAMGDEIHRGDGSGGSAPVHANLHVHAADPDKALLNGPQLPKNAINQDEIDKLMSGN